MIYDIYCPGHFRQFKTAAGQTTYGKSFCGGCQKKLINSQFLKNLIKSEWKNTMMTKVSSRPANPKTWTFIKNRQDRDLSMEYLSPSKLGTYNGVSAFSASHYQVVHLDDSASSARLLVGLCLAALIIFNIDTLQAVPLDTLREPMKAMKKEVWSYMFAIKVGAAIVGAIGSAIQSSLTPLGIGAGITAGIHFFDGVIGDGAAALIG